MGGGRSSLVHHSPTRHSGLLGLLGVDGVDEGLPDRRADSPFVLWHENEEAYVVFIRISGHGQWQRAGMDGVVIGLNGDYLINYLKLTYKPELIPDLLDDVHCIVSGWVSAQNEQSK